METLLHNPTERVTNILKIIAKNSDKLNFSSISKLTNMPKSTLSPISSFRSYFPNLFYWFSYFSGRASLFRKCKWS